jgi:hypothetical protein
MKKVLYTLMVSAALTMTAGAAQARDMYDGQYDQGQYRTQQYQTNQYGNQYSTEGRIGTSRIYQNQDGAAYVRPEMLSMSEIKTIQTNLKNQGYYTGAVDGIYGPRTHAAVIDFQDDRGLSSNGMLTTSTVAQLGLDVDVDRRVSTNTYAANQYNTMSPAAGADCVGVEQPVGQDTIQWNNRVDNDNPTDSNSYLNDSEYDYRDVVP